MGPDILPSQSGRILLVRPREEDDAAIAALRSHPETLRYIPFREGISLEEARALRIARDADETRVSFHIHLTGGTDSTTLGGRLGLSHIDKQFKSCEVGIMINPDYFRGGLATDALYNDIDVRIRDDEASSCRICHWQRTISACEAGWTRLELCWRERRGMAGLTGMADIQTCLCTAFSSENGQRRSSHGWKSDSTGSRGLVSRATSI
ncbi:hypothetical protein K438DRAFT_296244 [Mycena galopus ATCC 62051]|nr:hypothetical protein K438DRAFT_296244 [Mycena galopus ATCC 62051]